VDATFSQQLEDWTAFYGLAGGAAATLLGLLFVAVSLRLDIFRRGEIADVRLFASYTLGTFLFAGAVAALALAPHEEPTRLGLLLMGIGIAGLIVQVRVVRTWCRLNRPTIDLHPNQGPGHPHVPLFLGGMAATQLELIATALLLWTAHPEALGLLAVAEVSLLSLGTLAAWLLLSNAHPAPSSAAGSE
jgi:hypothetical protein